jgi:hypothetical protein
MKRKTNSADAEPVDREVGISDASRNPFARDYYKSRNLRVLAPDLVEAFPDSETVNEALRMLVRVSRSTPQKVSARRAAAPVSRRKKPA